MWYMKGRRELVRPRGRLIHQTHFGYSDYFDSKGNKHSSMAAHERYEISDEASRQSDRQPIEMHGLEETYYFTFSKQLAAGRRSHMGPGSGQNNLYVLF